ncbi:hypothetical protein GVAV_000303 [Gurleya vavrai]
MGRIRNKIIKRAAKQIVEKYYMKLDTDFHFNKRVTEDVAIIQSKRLKNKVAGYVTVLMKRIQTGHVKGIYIKKHEEERERKENFIPKKSILDEPNIYVDSLTMKMIHQYGYIGNYQDETDDLKEEKVY